MLHLGTDKSTFKHKHLNTWTQNFSESKRHNHIILIQKVRGIELLV